jgi:hypothetical protein
MKLMNHRSRHPVHALIQRQLQQLEHDGKLYVRAKQAWGIKDRKLPLRTRLLVVGVAPHLLEYLRHLLGP